MDTRGGILIAWKEGIAHSDVRMDTYSTSVQFSNVDGTKCWLTGVYGPQLDVDKLLFLQELHSVRAECIGP